MPARQLWGHGGDKVATVYRSALTQCTVYVVGGCKAPDTLQQGIEVRGAMQRERSEQLRSLSSVAGVMNGFAMSSLLQLNFDDRSVPYDGPASCGYAFTLGLTARPCCANLQTHRAHMQTR